MDRRKFIQAFLVTTFAMGAHSRVLASDTSSSETALQVAPLLISPIEDRYIRAMAQKFADFAAITAEILGFKAEKVFGHAADFNYYYNSLLRDFKKAYKLETIKCQI